MLRPIQHILCPLGLNATSAINNSIPFSRENVNSIYSVQNEQNNTQLNENTPGEQINWNEIERPEGKFRKHYRSIIESSNTTAQAKAIAKEMMGTDTYTPQSNNELLNKADARISNTSADAELNSLYSRVMNNEKINDVDIAVGERLIEYYSKNGDSQHLLDAIHSTAMAGTQAGRTVQAMALLNHMTPQGQVLWLQRSIDKMNDSLQQKYKNKNTIPQFELTEDMANRILETKTQEEMFKTLDKVYEELGQQVPKTFTEQLDEWRYFSMLANIKTHARNMIGNVAMHGMQRVKDRIAGGIEDVVARFNPEMERMHTLKRVSNETKAFAKQDLQNMDVQTMLGMNENKYNPQSRLQSSRITFKNNVLNDTLGKAFDLNSTALEIEDNIGLKAMYTKALGEYLTANNIDINKITDAELTKARNYAVEAAKEATFHQASSLATALNQMGRNNAVAKFALDAAVPFKKTPINVAKTGIQYSPVGLIKSAVYDLPKLRKGQITVNQYIDHVSRGLTGTGIVFIGYALAEAGILKASGSDDDKKEKYEEEQGRQSYSIQIGDKTYSLDWLAPAGIPLFIGAEINEQLKAEQKEGSIRNDDKDTISQVVKRVENIANGMANAMNPMSEMSMISGLTSILSSYNRENAIGDMIVNTGKSYINQYVPTALSQLARTTDKYERTTKSTKSGTVEKALDQTVNQIKSKIPGLRQTLPIKTDIWGHDVKQSENLPFRAFNNFINPSIIKDVSSDKVDKELNSLYAQTGESSVIPKSIDKKITFDGKDYTMTNKEYADYNKLYGETSYNLIKGVINSSQYKNLSNEQKQTAIENIYKYAKEQTKIDYAKQNKIDYEESTLSKVVNELKKSKGNMSNYFEYLALTKNMSKDKEKIETLANTNYSDKTKEIVFENTFGKDDNTYNTIKPINMDINSYLKYKANVENTKASAVNYLSSANDIDYEQKLLLLGLKYSLTNQERATLAHYINNLNISKNEKLDIYKKLKNFTIYDNGIIKF